MNDNLLITGAPSVCVQCRLPLCLRKQVINLALGNVDDMYCLVCLGAQSGQKPQAVITSLKGYIGSRDCFSKEWKKYADVDYCPDRLNCFPDICFEKEKAIG